MAADHEVVEVLKGFLEGRGSGLGIFGDVTYQALGAAELFETAGMTALGSGQILVDALHFEVAESGGVRGSAPGGPEEAAFGEIEPALAPLGLNHGFDEVALEHALGLELFEVGVGESFELELVFAGDDELGAIDGVCHGIEAGDGLAFGGTGSGGFLSVEAISLDLTLSRHGPA